MKKIYVLLFALCISTLSFGQEAVITGYVDSPCPSQLGRTIEIYVDGMVDFTGWNLVRQSNGGGFTENIDLSALGMVMDGFAYVTNDATTLQTEFGISTNVIVNSGINDNGNDGFQIIDDGMTVIDRFGEDGVDGTGSAWEHLDSYYYRVDGTPANAGAFNAATFIFGAVNGLDNLGTCNGAASLGTLVPFGSYNPTATTDPTLTITSPADTTVLPGGTTSVNVSIMVQNFAVGNPGAGIDGHIHWTINGVDQAMKFDTADVAIPVTDDESYTVFMQLVDNTHTPIVPAVNATVNFSVALPCTLAIGTITATCDAITDGVDTYTTTLEFSGGGTTTYTIDTGGVGTLGGDDPSAMASGTITITNVNEATDIVVTFTGDPVNSSCDITSNISSPNCTPTEPLPIFENFDYGPSTGDLTAVSGGNWVNHSGSAPVSYATTSLIMAGYSSSGVGGSATLIGSNSEDVNRSFAEQSSGNIYMSALVNISAVTTGNYFLHLKNAEFGFVARVGAKDDGVGNILFGIGASSSTLVYGTTPFSLNTTYLIVGTYNIDSGVSNLYVLTAPTATEPSTPEATNAGSGGTLVSSVGLRQSGDIPAVMIDGLNVDTSWPSVLSTEEFNYTTDFKIYPNPTSLGYINITSNTTDTMSVAVFDVLGKRVLNQTVLNNLLNVSSLHSGVYIVKISQNDATVTKKLVIK